MSAMAFLIRGALIAATNQRALGQIYIPLVADLLTLIAGLSHIALGVHWTTDVIGGWAFGSVWAVLWRLVARTFVKAMRQLLTKPKGCVPHHQPRLDNASARNRFHLGGSKKHPCKKRRQFRQRQ